MATLGEVRSQVATALGAVTGLRPFAYMPDLIPVGDGAVAVVTIDPGDAVIERITLADGYRYRLRVRVIVANVSDRAAQAQLDRLISPDELASASAWAALETDGAMGPVADYCLVHQATNYGVHEAVDGTVRYLAAELECEVIE